MRRMIRAIVLSCHRRHGWNKVLDDMIMIHLSAGMDDGVITSRVNGLQERSTVSLNDHELRLSIRLHSRGIINVKVIKGHDQAV